MPTPRSHDKLLSMQLGLPIHSCRGPLLLFSARDIVGFLAKHIVCRDMNEQPVHLLHHHCQVRRCLGIEFLRQGHIGLSSIYIRIGSTIYDGIYLILRNHATYSRQIGNIQIEGLQLVCLANIRKDIMVNTILSNEAHLIAKLTICSCNKYIHNNNSQRDFRSTIPTKSHKPFYFLKSVTSLSRYCPY